MNNLIYTYNGKSRDLKRIITALLKSGLVVEVKKINYVSNFSIIDNKVVKSEIKLLIIYTEKEDKVSDFLSKNFPQIEKISLS